MKKLLAVLLLMGSTLAAAQTADELLNDGKNTENVTTFGMSNKLQMYSPLKQINKSNVRRLVPLWSTGTMSDTGELAQPAIYNGVMYIVNGNWTFALDVATGKQIWRTQVEYDRAVLRISRGRDHARLADHLQRQVVPADARRAHTRARHENRQANLEDGIR